MPFNQLPIGTVVYGKTNANRGIQGTVLETQLVDNRWKYLNRWNGRPDKWCFQNSFNLTPPVNEPIPEIDNFVDQILGQQPPQPVVNYQQAIPQQDQNLQLVGDLG